MKRRDSYLTIGAVGLGAVLAYSYLTKKKNIYDLTGKIVLITGGSRGLGLNISRQLLRMGARVVICARDINELEGAVLELSGPGNKVMAIQCDTTDKLQVDKMITMIRDRWGSVDVLINNAGIIQVGPFENMTTADFENAMKPISGPLYTLP